MALDQVTVEYNANIDKLKADLSQVEQSMAKTDQAASKSGKKIEDAYKRPAGVLQKLQGQLKVLQDAQQRAFNPASVISLQKQIDQTKNKIAALTGQVQKTGATIQKTGPTIIQSFQQIGRAVGIAFGVQQVIAFTKEVLGLGMQLEQVTQGFQKLDRPELLGQLRTAVRGTVDDITLMKNAVKADNFKIPLDTLATLFEFAQKRASLTGESVDYLTDSIVLGLARKSPLILDNLGLQIKDINEEVARTGDFFTGATNVIERELVKMGDVTETAADRTAQLRAQWKNFWAEAGAGVLGAGADLIDWMKDLVTQETYVAAKLAAIQFGKLAPKETVTRLEEINKALATNAVLLGMKSDAETKANLQTIKANLEEEKREILFRQTHKSVKELKAQMEGLELELETAIEGTARHTELLIQKEALQQRIKAATGEETDAMKANTEARKKAIEEKQADIQAFAQLIAKAKEMRMELFGATSRETATKFGKLIADASQDKSGLGKVTGKMDADQKERMDKFLKELRARFDLEKDTVVNRLALLEFEKEEELRNTELTHAERLAIIKKYAGLEAQVRADAAAKTITEVSNILLGFNSIITEINNEKLEDELALIEKQKEAQLKSLDSQLESEKLTNEQRDKLLKQRSQLEEDFAKRTEAAREEAAKKQLKFTIAGIVLNQSAAIASAIAGAVAQAAGNPLGIAAILAITLPLILSGMAQALSAANAVELAEGEVGLKGPGTTKSDSIPARLSRGESVITAEGTKLDPDLLRAMNKGSMDFENYIQHTYVWPYMEAMIKAHSKQEGLKGMTFNDRNILKRLDTGNKLQIKTTQALIQALNKSQNKRRSWN